MFGLRNRSQSKSLSYDTQIELIFPAALFGDPVIALLLKQVEIPMEAKGNKVMLFTDLRTVAALNANPQMKNVLVKSGIGTVLYGWNSEQRTSFLLQELRKIAAKYAGNHESRRLAVFDLHRFVFNGMMGQLDPNPFAAPLPDENSSEEFDLAAAMQFMLSPEQLHKPKAPEHLRTSMN